MNFGHLKNGKSIAELDKAWEKLLPTIKEILNDMNSQLFNNKWLLVDNPLNLFIPRQMQSMSEQKVGLQNDTNIDIFVFVCLNDDGETIRIYTGLNTKVSIIRKVSPEDYDIAFQKAANNLVELLRL